MSIKVLDIYGRDRQPRGRSGRFRRAERARTRVRPSRGLEAFGGCRPDFGVCAIARMQGRDFLAAAKPGADPVYSGGSDSSRCRCMPDGGARVFGDNPGDCHLACERINRSAPAVATGPDSHVGDVQALADESHRRV